MEVPIEEMPQPARGRIESLMKTMTARSSIAAKMEAIDLLEKFYAHFPMAEKQVGDGAIEGWVYDRLKRDDDWVEDTALSLFEEAVATHEEAIRAQLCSSIGKDVPDAYEMTVTERDEVYNAALESAQSIADTYNGRLKGWIEEAKAEWFESHGDSYIGLTRFTLLKLVREKIETFDSWKIPEIAATEFSTQWSIAALGFWVVNKGDAELEYHLAPSTASDPGKDTVPICMGYANQWLSQGDAEMFPAHVNCVHFIDRTRVKSGSLPTFFLIGGIMYEKDSLPDC